MYKCYPNDILNVIATFVKKNDFFIFIYVMCE